MGGVCAWPDCECAMTCHGVDEAPAAASLAAGAIARSLDDAHAAYRARLSRAVADMQEASTVQN